MTVPASYLIFEILGVVFLVICGYFRIKKADLGVTRVIMELFGILLFGLLLEILAVSIGLYTYPPALFAMMIFNVPIIIGIGWSVILFSAMWFTDSLEMPEWSRVIFDAFLAVLIDLGMDAVAIRDVYSESGMWAWKINFTEEWFGVPWFNFSAWWFIAFSISLAIRICRKLAKRWDNRFFNAVYPVVASILGIGILTVSSFITRFDFNMLVLIIQMILSISVIVWKWRGIQNPITVKEDFPVYLIPLSFHCGFILLMLVKRYFEGVLPILWMSLLTLFIHIGILVTVTRMGKRKKE